MSAEDKDLHLSTLPSYPMAAAGQFMLLSSKGDLTPTAESQVSAVTASWQQGLHQELGSREYT